MYWNSVRWGKNFFCSVLTIAAKAEQKSLVPARKTQWSNQGRTPVICTPSICTLWSPFTSVSTVCSGHPSLFSSLVNFKLFPPLTWERYIYREKERIINQLFHNLNIAISIMRYCHNNRAVFDVKQLFGPEVQIKPFCLAYTVHTQCSLKYTQLFEGFE
jgi:hypothetical protein